MEVAISLVVTELLVPIPEVIGDPVMTCIEAVVISPEVMYPVVSPIEVTGAVVTGIDAVVICPDVAALVVIGIDPVVTLPEVAALVVTTDVVTV